MGDMRISHKCSVGKTEWNLGEVGVEG